MKRSMEPARGRSGRAAGFPPACRGEERGSRRPGAGHCSAAGGQGGALWGILSYVTVTGRGLPALGQAGQEPGPS